MVKECHWCALRDVDGQRCCRSGCVVDDVGGARKDIGIQFPATFLIPMAKEWHVIRLKNARPVSHRQWFAWQ